MNVRASHFIMQTAPACTVADAGVRLKKRHTISSIEMDMIRYKYLDYSEGSLCVISDGTMKFTAPKYFNDPFDCAPDFDPEKQADYLMEQKAVSYTHLTLPTIYSV